MAKIIKFDKEAREQLVKGIDVVADCVAATVGPRGRNSVIAKQFGTPSIINDGVSIAKEIELKDPIENTGAELIKSVSSAANEKCGDGTTTATILARAIIKEGLKKLDDGYNPVQMKEGISKATKTVVDFIKSKAVQVDDTKLEQVATVSAGNNAEIGKLIADAMKMVGKDGVVTVEESNTIGTNLKTAEGLLLDSGYISPYFVTDNERMECVLEKPVILVVDKKISLLQDIIPTLDYVAKNQLSLLIVAEDVDGEAIASLVVNTMRKIIRACAVKAPGFGDTRKAFMKDIAVLTGGTLWTEELGVPLDSVDPSYFGNASRVKVTKDETTIVVSEKSAELESHIKTLKAQYEVEDNDYQKEKLQERIAKLSGGVAVISVGYPTEIETKEKKLRIEDALNATRSAQEEGIVAGGGYTLLEAQGACRRTWETTDAEKDYGAGYDILINALSLPAYQIAANAGLDGDEVVAKSKEEKLGYNALTNSYENLVETGVIDPAKVTRSALENAASVAGLMLTTQSVIVPEPIEAGNTGLAPVGSPMGMMG